MGLTVNTNLSSLLVQDSLNKSTNALNRAIERMTTGYKINSAKDDAAGYAVATKLETKLSSVQVCIDNVSMGQSLLNTASSGWDLIMTHLQRMRDLEEEALNGTYGADSISAIDAEFNSRYNEIKRIGESTEYNGISVLASSENYSIRVGISNDANSTISVKTSGGYGYFYYINSPLGAYFDAND